MLIGMEVPVLTDGVVVLAASGQPIDPKARYEPVSSHAHGDKVFNPGLTFLLGDDFHLTASPGLWVREDAATPERLPLAPSTSPGGGRTLPAEA